MSITKQAQVIDKARSLRQQLNLSQASFAAKLGVSVRTVNRWENGHAHPSKMALKLLEEMLNQMQSEQMQSTHSP
ncbi:MAG: helix-turn-helix domain-containing protein [Spirulinaceae cyanobacterium]